MLTGKNRFCSFSWSTLPVLLQFCSSAKPQQNFFSFRILWGAGLRDFLLAFIFLPPEVPCYHGPSFAQFWWFCILFSFCFCMSPWFEFCWVLLVLHSVLLLFVHVMMVRVLLSFAGFAFCFAFVSVCYHGPSFAEFCGFALRFLFVSAYFSSNDPETKNRLRTDNFLISFSTTLKNYPWCVRVRERTQDHGRGAAANATKTTDQGRQAYKGLEPVVPAEAPQQGPRRTQPHKGRNRWFQ